MDGGFAHIVVRASCVRTAEPAHVSCTEDATAEQSQVREGLFEITLRYRSFDSNHAPHVCGNNMRRSSRDCCDALQNIVTRRSHPGIFVLLSIAKRSRARGRPQADVRVSCLCRGGAACRDRMLEHFTIPL